MQSTLQTVGRYAVVYLLGCLTIVVFMVWSNLNHPFAKLEPAKPAISAQATVSHECPKDGIKGYDDKSKSGLVPATIAKDKNKHLISSSIVAPDGHAHSVSTVLDSTTGIIESFDRKEPLPWLDVERDYEVGLYYGIDDDTGSGVIRLEGKVDFLQIKALKIALNGTADSDSHWFVGIGGHVNWK